MPNLRQLFEIFKAGFTVAKGKWQIDGVAVNASADELNSAALSLNNQVLAADGAITIKRGVAMITKAGVAVLTLANPVAGTDNFKTLKIISATAQAHTVSNAAGAGFNGGGAGSDVGTFGGAIGDNLVLVAYNGVWHVQSKVNVTLG